MTRLLSGAVVALGLLLGCGARVDQQSPQPGAGGADGDEPLEPEAEDRDLALLQGWYNYCHCAFPPHEHTKCFARLDLYECLHDFSMTDVQLLAYADCGCDWPCIEAAMAQAPPNPARETFREACLAACDGSLDPAVCEQGMLDASYLATAECLESRPCVDAVTCGSGCWKGKSP
ncbi:MAG: hypothetical protein R3B72_07600 [Polyangiaceae bacterium]